MRLVALILLLSAFSSLTLTEVVENFNEWNCEEFFIRNGSVRVIPTIFKRHQGRYKNICQRWNNTYRFATVYDTEKRIPVYSAYTFTRQEQFQRPKKVDWKIEPQLEKIKGFENKSMIVSPREQDIIRLIKNQAVDSDYSGTRYSKGHVFPSSFAADYDQAVSTFTLTNAAPQLQIDNEKWAAEVEQPMLEEINANCTLDQNNAAYIVTGVTPGNTVMNITRGDEVKQITVPSHFWSAYCCRKNKTALISGTYIAEQGNFSLKRLSMAKFNHRLTQLYDREFKVFPEFNC